MSGTVVVNTVSNLNVDAYGGIIAVKEAQTLTASQSGLMMAGTDGSLDHLIRTTSNGSIVIAQPTAANLNATIVGVGTAGTPMGGVVTVQGITGGTAIPVSGTVTALNASVSTTGTTPPSSATYIGGSVTTAGPTYTTGQMNALSLTTGGLLRVDGSAVTQPVSGTVVVTQPTAANLNATVVGTVTANAGTGNFNVVGTGTAGTPTGGVLTVQGITGGTAIPVSGTVTALNASVSTTGTAPPGSATYIGGSVTTASPTYTTGQMNALSLTTAGALRVDGSATTQPISAAALPLPAGASTSALQTTGNTSLATIVTNTTRLAQGSTTSGETGSLTLGAVTTTAPTYTNAQTNAISLTTTGLLRVDGSGVTQPVSGTVTANAGTGNFNVVGTGTAGTPTGGVLTVQGITGGTALPISGTVTALNASVSTTGTTPPGSATYIGGSVTTAAPAYTTGQMNALSLTTVGALRVDGSAVTQPISGTVAATQSGTWTTGRTWNLFYNTDSVDAYQSGTWTVQPGNIANTTPWLTTINQGGNSAAVTASNALKVDGSAVTQPVSGTVVVTQTTATNLNAAVVGTGTAGTPVGGVLTVQGIAGGTAIPVSGTVTALNASVSTTGTTPPGSATYIGGSVTTAVPTYTTGQMNALSLTTSGLLRVDGSAVTQPISATSLPLPTGAATSALQTSGNTSLTTIATNTTQLAQGSSTAGQNGNLTLGAVTTLAPTYTTGQTDPISLTTTGLLRVDGSGVTQPVSGTVTANAGTGNFNVVGTGTAGTPTGGVLTVQGITGGQPIAVTGTVTELNASVSTTGTTPPGSATYIGGLVTTASPAYTTGQMNALSLTTSGALRVDGSAVTQPISGTVTSNIGTTGGLALDSTLTKLTIAQNTAIGSNTQAMVGGSVTTAAPTYTSGNINPLSLTTAGALRVDNSGVIQPVSGTVAATQSGAWTTGRTWNLFYNTDSVDAYQSGTWTVQPGNIANTTPWLTTINQGGNSATVTAGNALKVDGSAVTQPVSGTVVVTQATAANLNATVVGTVTSNIGTTGGLALDSTLSKLTIAQSTALGANTQALVGGSVTTAAPTYTNGNINPLSLTTTGLLRVDGSGVTQPVSGTVTANAGTGNFNVVGTGTAGTPTGGVLTVQGITGGTAIPVSGTITALNASVSTTGTTPPGSATYIGGSVTTASPTYTTGQMNALSLTTVGALRVDGSAVTQPISATALPLPTGAATSALQTTGNTSLATIATNTTPLAQGSTTSGQNGELVLGAVTTNPPTYTTGQSNAFSLNTSGSLRVITQDDGPVAPGTAATSSSLAGGQYNSTLPTLTTTQQSALQLDSSGRLIVSPLTTASTVTVTQATAANLNATVVGIGTAGTPTGGVLTVQGITGGQPIAVTGTVTELNASVSTTGTTPPGSATYIGGSVTTAAPAYTTGQMNALSLTTAGLLRVDGSGVTQPVSGTVTVTQTTAANLNATVVGTVAATQSGAWSTGRTWALASGTDSVSAVQSGTWTVQQGTPPWTVVGNVAAGTADSGNGVKVSGVYNTSLPTLTNAQRGDVQLDSSSRVIISPLINTSVVKSQLQDNSGNGISSTSGALNVNISSGSITTGTTDKSSFTYGTSTDQVIGGVFQDTAPTLTAGTSGAVRLTTNRGLHVNLRDANGNEKLGSQTSTLSIPVVIASDQAHFPIELQDGYGNNISSQINGSQRALDVGINVSGVQIDPRSIRALTASDVVSAAQSGTWTVQPGNTANTTAWFVKDNSLGTVAAGTAGTQSSLAGGVFNTSLPTLTTGQQAALQVDSSGRLIIAPTTQGVLAEDHNYGTVGANTLRTASQIGNTTGAADFGTGAASAQTLRVTSSNFPTTLDTNYGVVGASTIRTASQIGNATGAATFGAGATSAQTLRTASNLYDGSGNAISSASNGYAGQQLLSVQVPNTTIAPVALGALSASISIAMTGLQTVGFQMAAGTFIGTITPQCSVDGGVSWVTCNFLNPTTGNIINSYSFSSANVLTILGIVPVGGSTNVRVIVTSYTSGTASCILSASETLSSTSQAGSMQGNGTIAAVNQQVVATTGGYGSVFINVTGTWVGALTFQAQNGDGNWNTVYVYLGTTGSYTTSTTTVNTTAQLNCAGYAQVRVIATAWTSGTATVSWNSAAYPHQLQIYNPSGAANVLVTAYNTDGNGNALGSPLYTAGTSLYTIKPDSSITGTLTALNTLVNLPINDVSSAYAKISGTWVGTIQFQGSVDGVTFVPLTAVQGGPTNAYTTAGFTTNGGVRIALPAGFTSIQAVMTAYTSGTATVVINTSAAVANVEAVQLNPANLNATVVGAGSAGTPTGGVLSVQKPDTSITGTLGALNANIQITLAGSNSTGIQIEAGSLIGTLVAEMSIDGGTTWFTTQFDDPATSIKSATIVYASANTATARTLVGVGGSGLARVRVSAYTSGTATATVRASMVNDPTVLFTTQPGNAVPGDAAYIGGTDGTTLRGILTDTSGRLVISPNTSINLNSVTQPLYGTSGQTMTITLAGLTNNSARASTAVDNTTALFDDVYLFFKYTTTTATSTTGYINVYGYGSVDNGTTYPEGITGTDAAVTLTAPPNLQIIAQINAVANTTTYTYGPVSFCRLYGLDKLPQKWGVVVVNKTGGTANATATNFFVKYQGINGQL